MEQNWFIHDGTGCDGAVMGGTWWYWVSITWYCLELSGTGLVKGYYACIY